MDRAEQGKSNNRKGIRFEQAVVNALLMLGFPKAHRLLGVGQTRDAGDIGGLGIRIECKNHKNIADCINQGFRQLQGEAGFVISKRRGKPVDDASVTFKLSDIAAIGRWFHQAIESGEFQCSTD